jgi:hypothetical protein
MKGMGKNLELPRPEHMHMFLHGNSLPAEPYPLHLKACSLFEGGGAFQADKAACSDDALPGEAIARAAKHLDHLPVIERVTRGRGNLRVRGHLAAGDLPDRFGDGGIALARSGRTQQALRHFAMILLAGHAGRQSPAAGAGASAVRRRASHAFASSTSE